MGLPPPVPTKSTPLITAADIGREIERLFGDSGGMLSVTVHGGEGDAADTYRELMESLAFHHGGNGAIADQLVDVPDSEMLAKTLRVLARPSSQRQIMDRLLTAFGKRFIEPLGAVLDPSPHGSLMGSLVLLRSTIMSTIGRLAITKETRSLLEGDIQKLLEDEYLARLTENEERVLQPRVRKLAQDTLKLLGEVFYSALQRWPEHADRIAQMVSRRLDRQVPLRRLPSLLRDQVVVGIEEFLWVETSAEIDGALATLYASHRDVAPQAPAVDRELYRELADSCWELIATEG